MQIIQVAKWCDIHCQLKRCHWSLQLSSWKPRLRKVSAYRRDRKSPNLLPSDSSSIRRSWWRVIWTDQAWLWVDWEKIGCWRWLLPSSEWFVCCGKSQGGDAIPCVFAGCGRTLSTFNIQKIYKSNQSRWWRYNNNVNNHFTLNSAGATFTDFTGVISPCGSFSGGSRGMILGLLILYMTNRANILMRVPMMAIRARSSQKGI